MRAGRARKSSACARWPRAKVLTSVGAHWRELIPGCRLNPGLSAADGSGHGEASGSGAQIADRIGQNKAC